MSLMPWRNKQDRPAGEILERPPANIRDEMERLFDRLVRHPFGTGLLSGQAADLMVGPRIDLAESDNDITVTAELPGLDPKDIEISVTGNVLTIRGEKKQEKEEKNRNYHYVERQFGSFQRSVQLPSSVDTDKIDAVSKNGTLTITLAKQAGAKPRRIEIKSG